MSLRVFFEDRPLVPGAEIELSADESHYLVRVRRAEAGTPLEVLDGASGAWHGTVALADPRGARLRVGDPVQQPPPAPIVDLLLGLPEPAVTLEVLAHACELGVHAVVLVACDRSQGQRPSAARVHRVLRSAQRQCGRPDAPDVAGPLTLEAALRRCSAMQGFIASERLRGEAGTVPRLARDASACLLVGPEGGFTPAELDLASAHDFVPVALGPWTLRTRTAAIAGLAALMGAREPA